VTVLQQQFGHKVQLIVGDPAYGYVAKKLLESLNDVKFKVVHPGHGYQGHFSEIDDSTLVIELGFGDPVKRVWMEYARPIAVITEEIDLGPNNEGDSETFWYEVPNFERAEDYDDQALFDRSVEQRKPELQESDPRRRERYQQRTVKLPGTPL
jgi:hypothetical protein